MTPRKKTVRQSNTRQKPAKQPLKHQGARLRPAQVEMLPPHDRLSYYCRDISDWPDRWAGFPDLDVPVGKGLVEEFKTFLISRMERGCSKSTIKIYSYRLFALGGELIRNVNQRPRERRFPARKLILKYVDDDGGPPWPHAVDDLDHARYDSVCKNLYRFMTGRTQKVCSLSHRHGGGHE